MSKLGIEEILTPKPEARPRIYAYTIEDKAHNGLFKVGLTMRDVKQRVAEQVKTAAIKNYNIERNRQYCLMTAQWRRRQRHWPGSYFDAGSA